jgi:hypothetical protein
MARLLYTLLGMYPAAAPTSHPRPGSRAGRVCR